MDADEEYSNPTSYSDREETVVIDGPTDVSIDTYRGIVQFNARNNDLTTADTSTGDGESHVIVVEPEISHQELNNVSVNIEGEVKISSDGNELLPSYEESQREYEYRDGELPPPYENDLPMDSQRPPEMSTAPSQQHRRRRTVVSFGDFPTRTRCKNCRQEVVTRLRHVPGTLTFVMMILILLIGGVFCCCLIPLCIHGLMDVQHRCPECNTVLGYYHRLG